MPAHQSATKPIAARQRGDNRSRLITLVHVARSQLRLTDEEYRTILREQGGAGSAGDMSAAQLQRVVDYFKKQGFKVATKAKTAPAGGVMLASGRRTGMATVLAADQQSRKARAMWLTLHAIGQVRDPSEAALLAYAKRQCKVDRLEWVRDTVPLLESLKAWLLRSMPNQVLPYASRPVEEWAGHMPPMWRHNWDQAMRRMQAAKNEGHVQILDQWLDLWQLIGQATNREAAR